MPRAHLAAAQPNVPLSVTAVSARLGVSASTLRTWERRYGLGPGDRRAGAHRRYLPQDVARLSRMVDLVHSGVAPADAAAAVLAEPAPDPDPHSDETPPSCPDELAQLAAASSTTHVIDLLEASVGDHGLIHTWSRLVVPALDAIRSDSAGHLPGANGATTLTAAFLAVLGAIYRQRPSVCASARPVVVMSDDAHYLAAQVVGVALAWYGLDVRLLSTEDRCDGTGAQRFASHVADRAVGLAIVLGTGASCRTFIDALTAQYDLDILLVGPDTPVVLDSRVIRVRTAAACVEEALALLAPDADSHIGMTPADG
ncbi:MerR family transcriptional regulator [Actinomyces sp. B33]|uniref:MerR family transcriptional regulator n=1 Tax=Actinomyces sp. B33 TaxID=2942131 RepID=UPI0023405082|nr:MerR family transcriptional regulator [Actinomyces sp. B33]MDC4233644.1 MerR family transcriptional regulator [Actinomyces sp. B33]